MLEAWCVMKSLPEFLANMIVTSQTSGQSTSNLAEKMASKNQLTCHPAGPSSLNITKLNIQSQTYLENKVKECRNLPSNVFKNSHTLTVKNKILMWGYHSLKTI